MTQYHWNIFVKISNLRLKQYSLVLTNFCLDGADDLSGQVAVPLHALVAPLDVVLLGHLVVLDEAVLLVLVRARILLKEHSGS